MPKLSHTFTWNYPWSPLTVLTSKVCLRISCWKNVTTITLGFTKVICQTDQMSVFHSIKFLYGTIYKSKNHRVKHDKVKIYDAQK